MFVLEGFLFLLYLLDLILLFKTVTEQELAAARHLLGI